MPQGYDGIRRDVEKCMRNSQVLKDMLSHAGIKTMLNELSNTVVFERPTEEVRFSSPCRRMVSRLCSACNSR